jgi:uncharacterized Zn finger protein (UPF0148 family)
MMRQGCTECREWALLKAQSGLPTSGDTYCARCGTREVVVSRAIKRLIRERDRRIRTVRERYPDAYRVHGQMCGPSWQDAERADREIGEWFDRELGRRES